MLSQKCQYALRALFELAKRFRNGPVKVAVVADAQAIPPKFLEVILSQLKQGGFVDSRRGSDGGYILLRSPRQLTVGEVIRFIEGPIGPVECVVRSQETTCALRGKCVFQPLWARVQKALAGVYDETTFYDLVEEDARMRKQFVPSYAI